MSKDKRILNLVSKLESDNSLHSFGKMLSDLANLAILLVFERFRQFVDQKRGQMSFDFTSETRFRIPSSWRIFRTPFFFN